MFELGLCWDIFVFTGILTTWVIGSDGLGLDFIEFKFSCSLSGYCVELDCRTSHGVPVERGALMVETYPFHIDWEYSFAFSRQFIYILISSFHSPLPPSFHPFFLCLSSFSFFYS